MAVIYSIIETSVKAMSLLKCIGTNDEKMDAYKTFWFYH